MVQDAGYDLDPSVPSGHRPEFFFKARLALARRVPRGAFFPVGAIVSAFLARWHTGNLAVAKRGKRASVVVSRFSLALVLSAPLAQAQEPPIKIGVIGPVTGLGANGMGASILGGARVFLAQFQQFGLLLGRRLEIVERDDQSDPKVGLEVTRELVEREHVVAIIGYGNTGVALPASQYLQSVKIPLIVSAATGVAITQQFEREPENYVFRVAASDSIQPEIILKDLIQRRKFRRIALLHDDSPYGTSGRDATLAQFRKYNLAPAVIESFKVGDKEMFNQLRLAQAANADAVICYSLAREAAMVVNDARILKWNVAIAGPWGLSQESFLKLAGINSEGSRMPVTFLEDDHNLRHDTFSAEYKAVNKTQEIPSAIAAAQTYDALHILTAAISQANATDGPSIQRALTHLKSPVTAGAIAIYTSPFTDVDHEAIKQSMVFMGEIRKQRVTFAYDEEAEHVR
ncbi:MAG: ABC transporter substrate-binding protein [Burkholderiaceae bacterium]|jgi:branched-chain amino acid transport system substrate-binding protein